MKTNVSDKHSDYFVPPLILKVEGLVKIYGQRRVVDGVDFHVNRGEIVGLIGPNGAGKTTSFRMACGLIESNAGVVFLNGKDVTTWPMYRRARDGGMGYLPQDKSVFGNLTVQNNLLGVMEMLGMDAKARHARCDELLEKFNLGQIRNNYAASCSGGERRRLEVARALVSNPKIILLDEPFAAIDPITVISIQEIIRQLAAEGISILITDHLADKTLEITGRVYVIRAGKVLCHGTPAEVLNNEEAKKDYFGEDVSYSAGFAKTTLTVHSAEPVVRVHHPTPEPAPAPAPKKEAAEPEARTLRVHPRSLPSPVPAQSILPKRPNLDIPSRPLVHSIKPDEEP